MTTKTDPAETTPEPEDGTEPILRLSTLAPVRPTIEVDESLYELRTMGDFGIEEQQRLTRDGAEFDKLWGTDKLTGAQSKRLKMLLDHMFDRVLDAPADVKAKMTDEQRSQVVLAFTLAPLAQAAARQAEQQSSSTTES